MKHKVKRYLFSRVGRALLKISTRQELGSCLLYKFNCVRRHATWMHASGFLLSLVICDKYYFTTHIYLPVRSYSHYYIAAYLLFITLRYIKYA